MILILYFQFYFLHNSVSFVKISINISGSSWLSEWGSGGVMFFNESVVNKVFCGTSVHYCLSVSPFVSQMKYYFGVYHFNVRFKHLVWKHCPNDGHVIQAAKKSTPLSCITFIHLTFFSSEKPIILLTRLSILSYSWGSSSSSSCSSVSSSSSYSWFWTIFI